MYYYVFSGNVLPERADVSLVPFGAIMNHSGDSWIRADILVQASQISAKVETIEPIGDIVSLKNSLTDAVRLQLDLLGYLQGCGYELEITSVLNLNTNEQHIFGVNMFPNIEIIRQERPKEMLEILPLFANERSDYLRRALADYRQAIRIPSDTAFHCFRAIETIRQYFKSEYELNTERESWDKMMTELDLERSMTDLIREHALPVRHGERKPISGQEREQMVETTMRILDAFIVYGCNGYQKQGGA